MNPLVRRIQRSQSCLQQAIRQFRSGRPDDRSSPPARKRRPKFSTASLKKIDDKSEWWAVDGEMHEIGENVPPRERFVIPRDNISNRRRKQLREQFMRRTRLVLKESEQEPWCKRYMELYQELRENWERLYWDEGYSNKLGQDHANYESAEDDDQDFSPYRRNRPFNQLKGEGTRRNVQDKGWGKVNQIREDDGWGKVNQIREDDGWGKVNQIRDKFEYDREKRMREKAFAPMDRGPDLDMDRPVSSSSRPLDSRSRYSIPQSGRR